MSQIRATLVPDSNRGFAMKPCLLAFTVFASLAPLSAAVANPVLLISIDGLRPSDIGDADKRGLKVPNLRAIMAEGAYASGVRNMLPTVTYPNHTTLVTGVAPLLHGISNNVTFDPYNKNFGGWYWYSSDIKSPTLWDAVHGAHQKVASISWPVSVGNSSIDYNVPEFWRAGTPDDLKLLNALSTPDGIAAEVGKAAGIPLAAAYGEEPKHDTAKAKLAAALITLEKPEFMTLHLNSVDGEQHAHGPDSPEAHVAIETVDTAVGELVAAAKLAEPGIVVAIVSDHGFAKVDKEVNLLRPFIDAGLVTLDPEGKKIVSWEAMPWDAGGSSEIVLAKPDDVALKAKVAALLQKLVADPASGVAKVIDRKDIDKLGGGKEASFFVDFKIGYYGGHSIVSPLVMQGDLKGTHGYFPTHREMRATFMIAGPGIPKKALGEIDMRDIAPTLAKVLDVPFPSATGKSLL
jgi:predicted AlkP superfamily pyrophosphatase or phosphodiesterase